MPALLVIASDRSGKVDNASDGSLNVEEEPGLVRPVTMCAYVEKHMASNISGSLSSVTDLANRVAPDDLLLLNITYQSKARALYTYHYQITKPTI